MSNAHYRYIVATQVADPNAIKDWCQDFINYLIVKEHGKNGLHEHYNVIVLYHDQRPDSLRRSFMSKIYSQEQIDQDKKNKAHPLCKAKEVYDLVPLIGDYLIKETDYEVVANEGFDLEQLESDFRERYKINKHVLIKYKPVSSDDFVGIFIDYVQQMDKTVLTKADFGHALRDLVKQGFLIPKDFAVRSNWYYAQIMCYLGHEYELGVLIFKTLGFCQESAEILAKNNF